MIEIDGKIVSTDILTEFFMCDLQKCKGECCVDGNSGAPLEQDEKDTLRKEYDKYRPYLKPEGVAAIEEQGFGILDADGDLTTPLINDAECAYSYLDNGITLCAVEKAWKEGRTEFRKPVSCHLYPIRVARFRNGTYGLNYHRWNVCAPACELGREIGVPVYKALKEPIERFFGEDFYAALCEAEKFMSDNLNE